MTFLVVTRALHGLTQYFETIIIATFPCCSQHLHLHQLRNSYICRGAVWLPGFSACYTGMLVPSVLYRGHGEDMVRRRRDRCFLTMHVHYANGYVWRHGAHAGNYDVTFSKSIKHHSWFFCMSLPYQKDLVLRHSYILWRGREVSTRELKRLWSSVSHR